MRFLFRHCPDFIQNNGCEFAVAQMLLADRVPAALSQEALFHVVGEPTEVALCNLGGFFFPNLEDCDLERILHLQANMDVLPGSRLLER
jgi:hypothetical protein